jgi:hypothetical protein
MSNWKILQVLAIFVKYIWQTVSAFPENFAIGLTYKLTSQNLSSTLDILSKSACFHRDSFIKWFLCKKYRQGIRNDIDVNYSCVNEKEMNNYILPKE